MLQKGSNVLVTGGTGFTGRNLTRRLVDQGCNVRVVARETSDKTTLADLPIEWIIGNVYDNDTIARACENIEFIFHTAAAYRSPGLPDDEYQRVHVESTKLLALHAAESPCFQKFVHVSTVGVHGHIDNPPADETAPFHPGDVYQRTKAEAELWIRDYSRDSGLPLTVIRPAAIFGPGDTRLLKLFRMAKLPLVPLIGFTQGLYHLIHVEDLVSFIVCAANDSITTGQIYICGNQTATSIKNIIATVASDIDRSPRFFRVPAWPVFALAHINEAACKLIGASPLIYPRRVAFFTKDRSFDTAKMSSVQDFRYQYSNETGLAATCNWYRQEGLL